MLRYKLLVLAAALSIAATGCGNNNNQADTNANVNSNSNSNVETAVAAVPDEYEQNNEESQLLEAILNSESLGKEMTIQIYLPKGYTTKEKYPVLYMLHDYKYTEAQWLLDIGLDKLADELIAAGKLEPLIIVAPNYDNSYGINSAEKVDVWDLEGERVEGKYEDYLYNDVVGFVDATFSVSTDRKDRYIGGGQMGGYAALHVGFRHPDLFSKVGGFGPALHNGSTNTRMNNWLYADDKIREERNPLLLAKNKDLSGVSVFLDTVVGDTFEAPTEELAKQLEASEVEVKYTARASIGGDGGNYSNEFWSSNLEEYLLFFAEKVKE